ncbi:MAG: four helix bundle protein [Lentisphaerae bacterium]|nr:four helix bundle protein [Lentisphaerota bacterium]
MKYERFEDVPVWQDSADLAVEIFELTEDPAFRHKGDIANQIQRAVLSISNNVAEGFERGTTQELITFLYFARGSAGEVRSILAVCQRIKGFAHLKSRISDLKPKAESISRQVRAWADSLQNTDIKGQRYLTEKSRVGYEQEKRAAAFMEKLKKANEEALAKRKAAKANPGIPDMRSEISDPRQ